MEIIINLLNYKINWKVMYTKFIEQHLSFKKITILFTFMEHSGRYAVQKLSNSKLKILVVKTICKYETIVMNYTFFVR